jgi:hypothetical protein
MLRRLGLRPSLEIFLALFDAADPPPKSLMRPPGSFALIAFLSALIACSCLSALSVCLLVLIDCLH